MEDVSRQNEQNKPNDFSHAFGQKNWKIEKGASLRPFKSIDFAVSLGDYTIRILISSKPKMAGMTKIKPYSGFS